MTLTSKQRAGLRSLANGLEPIFQVGKLGVGAELVKQLDDVLNVRELIKISVLETCELSPKEAAEIISEPTQSNVVQVIGKKIVLYRQNKNPEKRKIALA